MRKVTRFLTAATLACGAMAMATAANAADGKILTVRSNDIIQQSPQAKAAADKMKQEFERRKNDLEAEYKRFADDVKKFQQEADLTSAADRAKREKDLNTRKIDLDYKQRQFQEDAANRDRQLSSELMVKIRGVIAQIAKERGADLVISDAVYAADGIDITAEVLKRLQAPAAAAK
jgi:outer membrane protein